MGSPRIPFNFLLCLSSCVLLQGDEGPAGPPGVPGLEVSVADQEEVRLLGTELVGTCRQPAGEASNQSENTGSGLRRDTEGECWLTACLTLLGSMWLFLCGFFQGPLTLLSYIRDEQLYQKLQEQKVRSWVP